MKAVVCRQFGPPESLTIEELPSPRPGPGQVVVSVRPTVAAAKAKEAVSDRASSTMSSVRS